MGGPKTAASTVTINVTHTDITPVISLPGPQNAGMDVLVFSQSSGNAIVVEDVDAGTASIQVTLSANFGTITLASVQNLIYLSGNGTSTVVMCGPQNALNTAMNGMQFRAAGPSATLQVLANDLGNTGIGGPRTASGSILIAATMLDPNNNSSSNNILDPLSGGTTGLQTPSINLTNNGPADNNSKPSRIDAMQGDISLASHGFVHVMRASDAPSFAKTSRQWTFTVTLQNAASEQALTTARPMRLAAAEPAKTHANAETAALRNVSTDVQVAFDQVHQWKEEFQQHEHASWWNIGTTIGVTGSSLVVLLWLLGGSSLIANDMSVLPLWTNFDPLSVLDHATTRARDGHDD